MSCCLSSWSYGEILSLWQAWPPCDRSSEVHTSGLKAANKKHIPHLSVKRMLMLPRCPWCTGNSCHELGTQFGQMRCSSQNRSPVVHRNKKTWILAVWEKPPLEALSALRHRIAMGRSEPLRLLMNRKKHILATVANPPFERHFGFIKVIFALNAITNSSQRQA